MKYTLFKILFLFCLLNSAKAQNDQAYSSNSTFMINIVEGETIYKFTSNKMMAKLNYGTKKFEIKVPSTGLTAVDSTQLNLFYKTFAIDTIMDSFLSVLIDFPNDEVDMSYFENQDKIFVGSIDFGSLETKSEVFIKGMYNNNFLFFDFDILLTGPFSTILQINQKPIEEIQILARGVEVFNVR